MTRDPGGRLGGPALPWALAGAIVLSSLAAPAWAAAPQPTKPVAASFYAGRWYEIARLPNKNQRDCQGATTQFTEGGAGQFGAVQTCHKGSPSGEAKTFRTRGKVDNPERNKFTMTFFGVVRQQYFVLDSSEAAGGWAIMATPGGNYVWLLARRPALGAAVKAAAVARLRALGYPVERLEYPAQAQ
jgi:apolipoprotein D and lipocalin family protein